MLWPMRTTAAGPVTASVRFLEDRLINLTVAEQSNIGDYEEGSAGDTVAMEFLVTNTSNGVIDINLAAVNTSDTHNANAASDYPQPTTIYLDDGDGLFNDTLDTVVTTLPDVCHTVAGSPTSATFNADGSAGGATADCSIAGGNTRTVFVVTTLPNGITGTAGQISGISLVATAAGADATALTETAGADNSSDNGAGAGTAIVSSVTQANTTTAGSTIDTVLNDAAAGDASDVDSGGATDIARNGQASDSDSFRVLGATLVATKTAVVLEDPVNLLVNPKAIPGARVEYTITVDNDGTGPATNVVIADTVPAGTTIVTGTAEIVVGGVTTPVPDTLIIPAQTLAADNSLVDGGAVIGDDAEGDGSDADEAVLTFEVTIN